MLNTRIKNVLPYLNGFVLDIGCGTNELIRRYGHGIGVDVYQFGGADIIVPDSSNLPFENEKFDTVTIVASLNHIPNREAVIMEANRVLKRDGILIITMIPPDISYIWHKLRAPWDRDQNERGMQDGEVYGLKVKEVKKMLEANGFKLLRVKSFMLFINKIFIAQKI